MNITTVDRMKHAMLMISTNVVQVFERTVVAISRFPSSIPVYNYEYRFAFLLGRSFYVGLRPGDKIRVADDCENNTTGSTAGNVPGQTGASVM